MFRPTPYHIRSNAGIQFLIIRLDNVNKPRGGQSATLLTKLEVIIPKIQKNHYSKTTLSYNLKLTAFLGNKK